jgi:ketosteroid isomerase-like protein
MFHHNRRLVERFWQTMNTNDWRAVTELFHDDFVLDWPQSGERLRGRDTFVAVNAAYPAVGRWRFTVHRVIADEASAVSDVSVTDTVRNDRAISFFQLRDGRIWRVVEYGRPVRGRAVAVALGRRIEPDA